MDATKAKLAEMKKLRKDLASKLAKSAQDAVGHFENGSFEVVEQALVDCMEGICELKERIEKTSKKRRTPTNANSTKEAGHPA
jgi:hypothetical protein